MNHVCIALGTNIEPRESYIQQALARLAGEESVQIVKESPIYETAPVGYVNQARFLNLVIVVKTTLRSEEHTSELQSRGHLVCRLLLGKINCYPIIICTYYYSNSS